MLAAGFGTPDLDSRAGEWRRLGLFLAGGTAVFLLAVVGAAFVPFGWSDAIRRSAHPTIFVPLAVVLTAKFLRKDAPEIAPAALFNPWPVGAGVFSGSFLEACWQDSSPSRLFWCSDFDGLRTLGGVVRAQFSLFGQSC